jgi:TolB protein
MTGRFRPWLNFKVVFSVLVALFSMMAHAEGLALPNAQEKKPWVSIPLTKWAVADEVNARKFWKILSNDLATMGPFRIVQGRDGVESSTKSDLELITQFIHGHAGHFRVRVHVQDARTQKPIYRKLYDGSPVWMRRMAHRIADDFTEKSTGLRGTAESRIVFAQETRNGVREIFQVGQDGEGLTQLTHHESLSLSPTLAPDGRLAYITYKGGPPEIWGQREPGGPDVKLFPMGSDHSGALLTPAWSPVCNKLAFVKSDPHGRCNVMVLDLDRERVDQLTHEGVTNSEPAWDPTGKRIAFTSDRSGTPQIYMMESDGSSPRCITADGRSDSTPS